jgi:beta-phosphoglucomutase family hydrolase
MPYMDVTPVTITADRYDAVLFDLDGVLTQTAAVHAKAWQQMFDGFLEERARREHERFVPFHQPDDYTAYLDGEPRYDGVRHFLASRHITLPYGSPDDAADALTVCGLGNRKDQLVKQVLAQHGVQVYDGSVALLRAVRAAGLKTAVVSSSKNCQSVIAAAGIAADFDARVDGFDVEEGGLAGKPAPDTYLAAATQLGVTPARSVVIEDALAGVESGRNGHFGLVVGVDRVDADGQSAHADALRAHGADIVVTDLAVLIPAP